MESIFWCFEFLWSESQCLQSGALVSESSSCGEVRYVLGMMPGILQTLPLPSAKLVDESLDYNFLSSVCVCLCFCNLE